MLPLALLQPLRCCYGGESADGRQRTEWLRPEACEPYRPAEPQR